MQRLKVNFCAAPSSYKSTVCVGVESLFKQEGIITETSKEYAREYINTYGFPCELYEQLIITNKQNERDEAAAANNHIMLSDNPAVNAYVFGKRMLQKKLEEEGRKTILPREIRYLEELHTYTLKKLEWFDILIVFPPNEEVVQDGTRTETLEENVKIYNAIIGVLNAENISYHIVEGTSQERIEKCYQIIKKEYEKRNGFPKKAKEEHK